MKTVKRTAAIAAAAMMSIGAVSAVQGAELKAPGSQTIDVNAKYESNITTPKVYSVDITWESMDFTYSASGTRDWNPQEHAYADNTEASWGGGSGITVTNHSNKGIGAKFSFSALQGFEGLSGTFDEQEIDLLTAEGTEVNAAPKKTVAFTLGGDLDENITELQKVGTITVTLE